MKLSPEIQSPEIEIKKKNINIAKYVYFAILIMIILVLIIEVVKKFSYVSAPGEILFPQTNVQSTNNIRIKNIYVKLFQKIKKGEILFNYVENEGFPSQLQSNEQIKAIKNEIRYYQTLLNEKKRQLKQMEQLSVLEVYQPSDITNKELEIETIKANLLKTEAELFPIVKLEKIKRFYSPASGLIGRIFFVKGEVAESGDIIMAIYKPTGIKIRGYFSQESWKFIHPGEKVKIEFANGVKTYGTIKNIYFVTFPKPLEFKQPYYPYERNERSIVADINPDIKSFENNIYSNTYKMSVKIYIPRFKSPFL